MTSCLVSPKTNANNQNHITPKQLACSLTKFVTQFAGSNGPDGAPGANAKSMAGVCIAKIQDGMYATGTNIMFDKPDYTADTTYFRVEKDNERITLLQDGVYEINASLYGYLSASIGQFFGLLVYNETLASVVGSFLGTVSNGSSTSSSFCNLTTIRRLNANTILSIQAAATVPGVLVATNTVALNTSGNRSDLINSAYFSIKFLHS